MRYLSDEDIRSLEKKSNEIRQSSTAGVIGGYSQFEINDMKDNRKAAIATLKGLDWNWRSFQSSSGVNVSNNTRNYDGEFYLLLGDQPLKPSGQFIQE